ncbi:MAG: hypothetical protein ACFFB0_00985 [Promethearchaeota archaeon]
MIKKSKKLVYCDVCEREIVLHRKNFDHIYHEVLCFMVLLTLGFGFIIYFILRLFQPWVCPNCEKQFDLGT